MSIQNIREIYEHLHQYPELSLQEFKTTEYILKYLEKYPLKIEKLNPTGLIAVLDNNHKDTITFRTDIDALPIPEKNDVKYKSKHESVMHACGHDGHISMLLQFITNIFENNLKFEKNIMFVFQPAEESQGGALLVLASDSFKKYNITNIFGTHVWPQLDSGVVGLKKNALMGTNYVFKFVINGKSAHASTPQLGIDTTQALAEIIQNINYLISKHTSPFDPVVFNLGKITGGVATNVIIENIEVLGTIRAASDDMLSKMIESLRTVLKTVDLKFGTSTELTQTEDSYPTVMNNPTTVQEIINSLCTNNLIKYEELEFPSLASEDFGFYSQKLNSVFVFLGVRDDVHTNALHSPYFSFNVETLLKGVEFYEHLLQLYGQ